MANAERQGRRMYKSTSLLFCILLLCGCAPQVVVQNELGNSRYAAGSYGEALGAYQLAQVDAPDRAEPYYNAANAHNRLGDLVSVTEETRRALKADDDALKTRVWYNLGNAYFDAQQWTEAIKAYQESLRLDPADMDAKQNLELAQRELAAQDEHPDEASAPNQDQDETEQDVSDDGQDQEQDSQGNGEADDQQPDQGESEQPPQGESSPDDDGDPTPQPQRSPAEAPKMTAEQASALLEALLGQGQTLQEHLQELQESPVGRLPQDW